jgi:predicted CopG family antitoxin
MTKQVALSNEAYALLAAAKRDGESFSQLMVRLMREADLAKRDPMHFIRNPPKMRLSAEEHLRLVREMRDAPRDPWETERQRQGKMRNRATDGDSKATAES